MNSYVWIALLSYFGFAAAAIGDKFILSRAIKHPIAYAFYIGLLSPIVIILAPFGLELIGFVPMLMALAGGASFTYALVFLYRAINQSEPSKVAPIVGGLQPIVVLLLAFLIVGERLLGAQLWAYGLMVIGAILISFEKIQEKWSTKALLNAALAAFFFALAFTLYKYTYGQTNFISGLIWTRFGLFLGALSFLAWRPGREIIFADLRTPKPRTGQLAFLGNFSLGAVSSFLQNLAISLGSVSIVNAMAGTQFVFLLILGFVLSRFYPNIVKENISRGALVQKIIAIILIGSGIVIVNL